MENLQEKTVSGKVHEIALFFYFQETCPLYRFWSLVYPSQVLLWKSIVADETNFKGKVSSIILQFDQGDSNRLVKIIRRKNYA